MEEQKKQYQKQKLQERLVFLALLASLLAFALALYVFFKPKTNADVLSDATVSTQRDLKPQALPEQTNQSVDDAKKQDALLGNLDTPDADADADAENPPAQAQIKSHETNTPITTRTNTQANTKEPKETADSAFFSKQTNPHNLNTQSVWVDQKDAVDQELTDTVAMVRLINEEKIKQSYAENTSQTSLPKNDIKNDIKSDIKNDIKTQQENQQTPTKEQNPPDADEKSDKPSSSSKPTVLSLDS
ncbi:hypothetical protein [Moraxella bovoculi]|uniref:hypothetical protein n=1 Tax=Moraxella bovoculi TaxID=386891 RepID=UPI0013C34CC1|nr:hypothetical protein [Moraxella bovoculi]